jgi:hypothetical protein
MTAEYRPDRHLDMLEFLGCDSSAAGEARATLEMLLLRPQPIPTREPNAGSPPDGRRGGDGNAADGHRYPPIRAQGSRGG